VVIVERTESGPASAPVGAHRHPARLKQVRDTDPLPQRRAKVSISSVHETRIIALRSAGTASGRERSSPGSSGTASATSIKVDWGSAYSRTIQSADPRRQGCLQRCIASIAGRVEGFLRQLKHRWPSHHLFGCQVEQGENDAGRPLFRFASQTTPAEAPLRENHGCAGGCGRGLPSHTPARTQRYSRHRSRERTAAPG